MTPDSIRKMATDLRTLAALEEDNGWGMMMVSVAFHLDMLAELAEIDVALIGGNVS